MDRHIRQQAVFGAGVDGSEPGVQQRAATRDELLEVRLDRDRQRAGLLQLVQGVLRDQPLLEGTVPPTAADPDVAGLEAPAQLGQHAEFVMASVNGAVRQHEAGPTLTDEASGRRLRQGSG